MKIALTGGAYEARSVVASAQRCRNLYIEPTPQAQGEPMPAGHYPTPGTRLLSTVGSGPIRGIRQAITGAIFCVSGSGVYQVNSAFGATHIGDITPGMTTPVSMVDNGLDMVIVDGSANGWKITLADNTFAPIVQSGTLSPVTAITGTDPVAADNARYQSFTPTFSGRITSVTVSLAAGFTGHMKCVVYPAAMDQVLGSAVPATNPVTGVNTFLFADDNHTPPSIPVDKGKEYWVGFCCDQSAGAWNHGAGSPVGARSNTTYATFPVAFPVPSSAHPNPPAAPVPASPLICTILIETDPGGVFAGADKVDYLDTYLLFNKPGTPQFYSSDSLALSFDPLWWANKESCSDLLRTLVVAKRDIWLLGDRTTEIFANVGAADFPFQSQPEVFIDHGIVAKYSASVYDNGVFWLSRDRQGQGIVIMGIGYQTKRISTYAIEAEIAGYTKIDDAIGFTYQLAGHAFYVLTFPTADKTWSYDITTEHWHEWSWLDTNGVEHRHRANCYWLINGTPVVGDWQNGNLYALDMKVFTDNTGPIKRTRSFPHMVADGDRVFYRQFLADFETGTSPNPGVMPGPANLISLRWSNDRGHTFGNPVTQSIGETGDYLTSLQWQRLGLARDRVWELSWSVPMLTVLQGAWIDATRGDQPPPARQQQEQPA